MKNPFEKKVEEDPMELLRQALLKQKNENAQKLELPIKVETSENDPQLTIEKHESITISETLEPKEEMLEETFEDKLKKFRMFLDIVRGKIEIGSKLKPLLNPDNLQTTTRLSAEEVDFVSDAHWLANQWKVFEPLRDLANEVCESKISEAGKGREEAISFMGALTEGKLLKGLMLGAEVPPKKSRFNFRFRNKGKQGEEGEQ